MTWSHIVTIYGKELRDMLRDRRTLISMIVIPTLVMPAIMLGFGAIAVKTIRQAQATAHSVMVIGGEDSPAVRAALEANGRFKLLPAAPDWKRQISEKQIRAAVEIPAGFDAALERGEPAKVSVFDYEGELRSTTAAREVREFFHGYREKTVLARLTARGLPATFVKPFDVRIENVAPPEKVGGNAFGGIIPYLFIFLSFTGAMYPAMDLTAGEKERGTMETILCSPVSRIDLVLGKFFMVLTASLCTVLFSLLSMAVTFVVGGSLLLKSGAGAGAVAAAGAAAKATTLPSVDPLGIVAVIGMVLPMAVLFSAGLLALSLFAKSFKEAQSYISPLIVLLVVPAALAMLPGIELNARLALVPVLNVSLVSKELVSGVWHWQYISLIFVSTCVYAVLALAFAVRMFKREDVIFRV